MAIRREYGDGELSSALRLHLRRLGRGRIDNDNDADGRGTGTLNRHHNNYHFLIIIIRPPKIPFEFAVGDDGGRWNGNL